MCVSGRVVAPAHHVAAAGVAQDVVQLAAGELGAVPRPHLQPSGLHGEVRVVCRISGQTSSTPAVRAGKADLSRCYWMMPETAPL